MEKLSDDEIQRFLENGLSIPNHSGDETEDVKAYKLLFEQLAQKPEIELSIDFSNEVVQRIQAKKDLADNFKYYFSLLGIVLLGAICATYTIAYMNSATANQILNVIREYKWITVLGVSLFLLIQYLDQRLIREKISS